MTLRSKLWIRRVVMVSALPVLLYFAAALAGSHIPANASWREAPEGVTIYVTTNGYHTGLILPTVAAGHDWSLTARPTDLPNPEDSGAWLLFGWGDRQFYLETPTWAEFKPSTGVAAIIGSGGSLIHVDHLYRPDEAYDPRPIRLTRAEYLRLVAFIRGTFAESHEPYPRAIKGYGTRDVFFPAQGRYSLFKTCNSWTADALRAAGVKVAIWTPFSGGVMRWF